MKNIRKSIILLFIAVINIAYADSLYVLTKDPITSSLFSDRRARQVGDIITIQVTEASSSSQSGKTTLSNSSSLEAKISSLLYTLAAAPVSGTTNTLYESLPYLGSKTGSHRGVLPSSSWNSKDDFEGDGELSSSNDLQGVITASIIEVLPNGNFIIEGKKSVVVDKQQRMILLSGIIRPEDVGADNSVLSRYIANAKIEFTGDGPISQYRKRSVLQKIWDFFRLY